MASTTSGVLAARHAEPSDLPALVNVFAKSFHPVSPFMRRAFPDTPIMREWWKKVHTFAIDDPDVRLLIVTDLSSDSIVALLRYRIHGPSSADLVVDAGTWSRVPLSVDHDHELCNAFTDFLAEGRRVFIGGRPHIFVELLATVHEFKGRGVGRLLIDTMCREADQAGWPCFVETNGAIVKFYEKFGFKTKAMKEMPGSFGYEEFIMVRPAGLWSLYMCQSSEMIICDVAEFQD
ncbi:acyl-CoA N-acyltransferase [Rhizodiscina lignyota]|uniref:Acyl-CoA N-acyltransferase n=1 Tax=Rhizodiscina lignyota TaxID=1504668 RepID=A0A9P4IB19_9PEZI|nr:acyl-CoA N-acyltransferase [Rhizodiscina lignyota]